MAHLPHLIVDLAIILGAAAITTLLFKWLKQPLVLGYILAGVLVGPKFSLFPTISDPNTIRIWADIGVIVLLFSLGLEFNIKKLVKIGGTAAMTGVYEILAMIFLGYLTGLCLGWSTMDSIFLGGIVSISSTTIIIRAFEELGVKTQKFAGNVFGILVIEDIVAVLLLVLLSTLAISKQFFSPDMLFAIMRLAFFLVIWFLAGIFLVPSILRSSRKFITDETLLIIALALCLLMVVIATSVGFSPALGAFIMGSILAGTPYAERIEHLLTSIKDLFGAVFFVSVGMLIEPAKLVEFGGPIALITLVVIVGKAVNVTLGALVVGQPLKQSLQTGMSLAQIGEFSFIIATLGLNLKVTSDFLYAIAVAVSALTAFTTPYMIRASGPLYNWLDRKLSPRTKMFLSSYSSGAQTIGSVSDWYQLLREHIQIMIVNTVVILGIILMTSRLLLPLLHEQLTGASWAEPLAGFLSFVLMAPFLWALALKRINQPVYTRLWTERRSYRGPLVTLAVTRGLIGLGLVLLLLQQFFPVSIILFFIVVAVGIWLVFGKRLPLIYHLIEKRFLLNLNARQIHQEARMGRNLLPWDAHLSYFEVTAESPGVGFTLAELALREKYGVNVISIARGSLTVLVPSASERFYPGDKIAVIGTDQQLEQFNKLIEPAPASHLRVTPAQEISLQKIAVDESFPFAGMTIRESRVREKTQGLIVGIERKGTRILNPDSTTFFHPGDVIWLAGNTKLIKEFQRENRLRNVQ
ncbi:CPA2 family monovalent cation:H+ antiporter-2 [Larkinella arboricola]|uniref:CPA2 family monovalent cation:H+ antiporter-2 n=1 Tax=Larkinella arboricola TaxID=643671 RepID=A0A327X6I7_LARAB|nr:cation:proton antiporter [Larkinella arboricola]RAK02740.1 CPA2 family monovalent cation:H+ antiporter-2 [Larkinella arboricola]